MVQAPPKPKATVIDHWRRWTVFLPQYAGIRQARQKQPECGASVEEHPAAQLY